LLKTRITCDFLDMDNLSLTDAVCELKGLEKKALGVSWQDVRTNMHRRLVGTATRRCSGLATE
jgi:hypothetical protein